MKELIVSLFLLGGTTFSLLAAVGVLRLPDLWTRMHAVTKAGTLGAGLLLSATAVHFGHISVVTTCVATIFFLLMTAPVASHLIGRAGYFTNVPLWEGTVLDEFKERAEGGPPDKIRNPYLDSEETS